MSNTAALRVHTPAAVEKPLPTKIAGADQLLAFFEHPEVRRRILPQVAPGDDYERVVACIMKATRHEPKLLECSTTSLADAAATIIGWRLEIGETAYLIPYKGKVVPVMGYQGMAQILITSGVVRAIEPTIVYANDTTDFRYGTDAYASVIPPKGNADRGPMVGALLTFRLKFGHSTFRYITVKEVDEIRQRYSLNWKAGPVPPWYMLKTLLRQSIKFLNTTPALQKAFAKAYASIEEDERIEMSAEGELSAETGDAFGSPASQPLQLERGEPADEMMLERTMSLEAANAFIVPIGSVKGQRLDALTPVQMRAALYWTVDHDTEPEFQLALATVLDAMDRAEKAQAERQSGATGDGAVDAGAPQDAPAGTGDPESPAPPATPFALTSEPYEDPYPEPDPKLMSTAALQAEVWRHLAHPSMSAAFVAGTRGQITSETTHVELQKLVRELRKMVAAAPAPRRKGERQPHTLGKLPGGI